MGGGEKTKESRWVILDDFRAGDADLSQRAQLHDDPHRVLGDHANQLDDVRVVKLPHGHCRSTSSTF